MSLFHTHIFTKISHIYKNVYRHFKLIISDIVTIEMKQKEQKLPRIQGIFPKVWNRSEIGRPEIVTIYFLKYLKDQRQLRLASNVKMEEKCIQTSAWTNSICHT